MTIKPLFFCCFLFMFCLTPVHGQDNQRNNDSFSVSFSLPYSLRDGYVDSLGAIQNEAKPGFYSKRTQKLFVKPEDLIRVTGYPDDQQIVFSWYRSSRFLSNCQNALEQRVPQDADGLIISFQPSKQIDYDHISIINAAIIARGGVSSESNDFLEVQPGVNLLNPEEIVRGKAIDPSGKIHNGDKYSYTGLIPVNVGDTLFCTKDIKTHVAMRYVTAYDSRKKISPSDGVSQQTGSYVVPEGISYVRISLIENPVSSDTRITKGKRLPFTPYEVTKTGLGVHDMLYKNYDFSVSPLSSLPDYIVKNLAYKPLGTFSKPYICLVSDDGLPMLATYTIPMIEKKGVPLTMAIMSDSAVVKDEQLFRVIQDAVTSHGCSVAQHGGIVFPEYNESALYSFLEKERKFFEEKGIQVKGVALPGHQISPLISALCGGVFGVVRSGYEGVGKESKGLVIRGPYYANTSRSNLFGLSSCSITDNQLETHKAAIDYAIAHNSLIIRHWHDNAKELTEENKRKLEAFIDYGLEKGVTFVTLGDIPYLP